MGTNYYAELDRCENCGRSDRLHIGKSSVGWQFIFRCHTDREPSLCSWVEWQKVLAKARIVDEYGAVVSLAWFQEFIAVKAVEDRPQGDGCDFRDPFGHAFWNREFR